MIEDFVEIFFSNNRFFRTPDNKVGRLIRQDRFYADLELCDKQEESYQLKQLTPALMTREEKEQWIGEYTIASL